MGKPRLYYNGNKGISFPKLHTVCKCVECKDNYVEDGEIWPDKEEFDGLNHGEGQHGKPENGVYLIKWSTGHKRYEWEYKNGKRADGVAMGWYPDGKPKQLSTWKNGELNGLRRYWWASGHIQRDENLISGDLNGESIWYHEENGRPKIKGYYQNGIPEGLWTWYTNNNEKIFEGYFKDGKKDGTWKSWIPEYDEIGLK
tara:strand:+ start:534 stop:1130 length:597 start_codon:yes stop_codon:yes gene_type:complete